MAQPKGFSLVGLPAIHIADQLDGNSLSDYPPANGQVTYIGWADVPGVIVAEWEDAQGVRHEGQFKISG